MPGTPYLVDSNILLRWVKPDDRDYRWSSRQLRRFLRTAVCFATHRRTLRNSGTPVLDLSIKMGLGFPLRKPTAGPEPLRISCGFYPTARRSTRNGVPCL